MNLRELFLKGIWEELRHPRDKDGKFASNPNQSPTGPGATNEDGSPKEEDDDHKIIGWLGSDSHGYLGSTDSVLGGQSIAKSRIPYAIGAAAVAGLLAAIFSGGSKGGGNKPAPVTAKNGDPVQLPPAVQIPIDESHKINEAPDGTPVVDTTTQPSQAAINAAPAVAPYPQPAKAAVDAANAQIKDAYSATGQGAEVVRQANEVIAEAARLNPGAFHHVLTPGEQDRLYVQTLMRDNPALFHHVLTPAEQNTLLASNAVQDLLGGTSMAHANANNPNAHHWDTEANAHAGYDMTQGRDDPNSKFYSRTSTDRPYELTAEKPLLRVAGPGDKAMSGTEAATALGLDLAERINNARLNQAMMSVHPGPEHGVLPTAQGQADRNMIQRTSIAINADQALTAALTRHQSEIESAMASNLQTGSSPVGGVGALAAAAIAAASKAVNAVQPQTILDMARIVAPTAANSILASQVAAAGGSMADRRDGPRATHLRHAPKPPPLPAGQAMGHLSQAYQVAPGVTMQSVAVRTTNAGTLTATVANVALANGHQTSFLTNVAGSGVTVASPTKAISPELMARIKVLFEPSFK